MSEVDAEAERITGLIYKAYGSHTGYLFGLEPGWRRVVLEIVKQTIRFLEEVKEE